MINKGGYEYDSVFVITKDEIYMYCILGMEFSLLVPNLLLYLLAVAKCHTYWVATLNVSVPYSSFHPQLHCYPASSSTAIVAPTSSLPPPI